MSNVNRQEFLFLYESIFANANGDPLNDNRPRIDEETGLQYVTMYRLKRTVRDYLKLLQVLNPNESNNILLQPEKYSKGNKSFLKSLEMRLSDANAVTLEDILKQFIDIRLFGIVNAVKNNSHHLQGPIQISYGKSLHIVKEEEVQISPVMPNGKEKLQGTLGANYIVPYALIAADGSINQFNAKKTKLTQEDVDLFYKALIEGTTDLKTTSKNQNSLFLLKVEFNKENELANIGNLKDYISLVSDKEDVKIRSIEDYQIDITKLVDKLNSISHKLENVEVIYKFNLKFIYKGENVKDISSLIPKVTKKVL